MNQISFDPWTSSEYEQRHEELIKESEQYRLAKEISRGGNAMSSSTSKILALIGKEITAFGRSLEARNHSEPDTEVSMTQQSSTGGCA